MAGAHLAFCRRLKPLLEAAGLADRLWIIGGNIPAPDVDALRALGFAGVFPVGTPLDATCDFIRANAPRRTAEARAGAARSTEEAAR